MSVISFFNATLFATLLAFVANLGSLAILGLPKILSDSIANYFKSRVS